MALTEPKAAHGSPLPIDHPPVSAGLPFRVSRRWRCTSPPQSSESVSADGNNNEKQNNDNGSNSSSSSGEEPKDDRFYRTWDKFTGKKSIQRRAVSGGPTSASQSFDAAVAQCKAKVAAIADECRRLNKKYTDPLFCLSDEDAFVSLPGYVGTEDKPLSVKPMEGVAAALRVGDLFEKPKFFIDGAQATDVRQGLAGDCWFLAGLSALSGKDELLRRLCVEQNDECGVYGFVFYRDGHWFPEVIDDRLCVRHDKDRRQYLLTVHGPNPPKTYDWSNLTYDELPKSFLKSSRRGSDNLFFAHCRDPNETWLPLIEKAYAKAHLSYQNIDAGFPGEAIEDLTGGVNTIIAPEDILNKDRLWDELCRVNKDFLFGCGARRRRDERDDRGSDDEGLVRGHAYTVLEARTYKDWRLLKIHNPWGEQEWNGPWSDGSKEWTAEAMQALDHTFGNDGTFYISLDDFMHHYGSIDRTRLFGSDWYTSEEWLSAKVPRSAYFLDSAYLTHTVRLTTTRSGPVVLVLCQPDTRYFQGLEGRYSHLLHFRVSRINHGENEYLVRSMYESGSGRSCNAEVDLEAGEYEVRIKITSSRKNDALTAAEVMRRFGDTYREKVLATGRLFDEAFSRGDLRRSEREAEEATKQRRRRQQLKERRKTKTKNHEARKRRKMLRHRVDAEKKRKKAAKRTDRRKKKKDKGSERPVVVHQRSSERSSEKQDSKPEDDAEGSDEVSAASSVEDDDFEWDSEFDAPLPGEDTSSESDEGDSDGEGWSRMLGCGESGEVDRWEATAVVGLRIYTQDVGAQLDARTQE